MTKIIKKFTLKVALLTIILGIISAIVFIFIIPNKYFDTFPFILLAFPIVSVIVYVQLLKSSQISLAKFNIAFMISFLLKLFIYLGLAATIISLEKENKASFVISLLIMYLVYTIFDTKMILDDIKKLEKEKPQNKF